MAKKKDKTKVQPTESKLAQVEKAQPIGNSEMLFTAVNYRWMLIGVAVMFLGFLLMAGGHMPSPDVWDESLIYSARRTLLAPIVILAGLGIEIYAIFKK